MKKLPIKRKIKKWILGYDVHTYYFAQGGEDAILRSIFQKKISKKEKGFFVDVGAYHPYNFSILSEWTEWNQYRCLSRKYGLI